LDILEERGWTQASLAERMGCPVSGITKWFGPGRALVMLSFRYKSNDHFWFTLFHELAHLLFHGKKLLFLEGWEDGLQMEQEAEADAWASNILIPANETKDLKILGDDSVKITEFACRLGIAPGIVVGRLQREGLIPWASGLNHLKVRYEWVETT
jgi:transcriptional regulator with XRE-family HTH domain